MRPVGEQLGARPLGGGVTRFRVWAPRAARVEVVLLGAGGGGGSGGGEGRVAMTPEEGGYWVADVERAGAGTRYRYALDGGDPLPDPASRWQPEGVAGASAVWRGGGGPSTRFARSGRQSGGGSARSGRLDHVFYELHVGTFTPEGTFDAVIPHLARLADLGVSAVELMPVAEFPGARNWGYDGVFPFAAQSSYGGPDGLAHLVAACHAHGLACFLDVVYNHLGPEGNVLPRFAPYFDAGKQTPWGPGLAFDGPARGEVRRFFIENALWWLLDIGMDGLRLDAVHAIDDRSDETFLSELAAAVDGAAAATGRPLALVAESAERTLRHLLPRAAGGSGMAAQWNDDFHHALHAALTGEQAGYYADFGGPAALEHLARALRQGFVFLPRDPARREWREGEPIRTDQGGPAGEAGIAGVSPGRFVAYAQNHDQVANRVGSRRLGATLSFERTKLAAGALLLSPFQPLLFMGEEYGETAAFAYFTSHADPSLGAAVWGGRAAECVAMGWPEDAVPDPQDPATFVRSTLDQRLAGEGRHRVLHDLYRELLRLRRTVPGLGAAAIWDGIDAAVDAAGAVLTLHRREPAGAAVVLLNVALVPAAARLPPGAAWKRLLDSAAGRWDGPGSAAPALAAGGARVPLAPESFVVYAAPSSP